MADFGRVNAPAVEDCFQGRRPIPPPGASWATATLAFGEELVALAA